MRSPDFLVVGGGIAGLSAAIRLAEAGTVLCVTKEELAESNTSYAQGGIAVAMGGAEDVRLHLGDTLAAGDGLVDRAAAKLLVGEGPERVEELLSWGTEFDRSLEGGLLRTREGAHSLSRILHAHGDATGREIARALLDHARGLPAIELREWTTAIDLVVEQERVVGVSLLRRAGGVESVRARAVLLATGGAGQVFSDTTNPALATGDGIAMAYRAGAALEDMEFYQFHPTAFAQPGAPRFLLSEALRGEGAVLRNADGERFMPALHPAAELAPRDVVARAITREDLRTGAVFLDMRAVEGVDLHARFPGISQFLSGYRLELGRDLIPVRPAAHYLMGGIRTDVGGRASLAGLFAAGEAACTGVHGANRLASNSLLEGLVFGVATAETMIAEAGPDVTYEGLAEEPASESRGHDAAPQTDSQTDPQTESATATATETEQWIASLRALMWLDAGLLREGAGLRRAARQLAAMQATMPGGLSRRAIEARNLHTIAEVIVTCALGREESRGAHFRSDFPEKGEAAEHSVIERGVLRFVGSESAATPVHDEAAQAVAAR